MRLRTRSSPEWLAVVFLFVAWGMPVVGQEISADKTRSDVEKALPALEAMFTANPADEQARRELCRALFQLGEFWRTSDLIQPLITDSASNVDDIRLGAKLSLLLGDFERAGALFERLKALSQEGSEDYRKAIQGLIMVAYQTNQFARARDLALPPDGKEGEVSKEDKLQPLLTFMQKVDAAPYEINWRTENQIAHLAITNDFRKPGALPEVDLVVNGHKLHMLLDTGGDRLYIDEEVAKTIGIRNLATRTSRYAYTGGKFVEEPLGVADTVDLGDVRLSNVPVIVAKWKAVGQKTDGVLTTQILKQFLTTIDYDQQQITFRPRTPASKADVLKGLGDKPPTAIPFVLSGSHLMFAKGGINDRTGLNLFVDSGLAASMPMVIVNETVTELGLDDQKTAVQGKYFWVPISKLSLGELQIGQTAALGNVLVEENIYRANGFFFDGLISHEFLKQFGSWTIDFDAMQYYFPAK